jgi:zinc transporter
MAQTVAEKLHKLDFDDEVTGLIYGHVFRTSEPPQRVSSQQACQAYQTLSPGEGFIWLHLNLNHAAAEKWLKNHFEISEFFFDEIRHGSHTTRIERQGEDLFAVLNDVIFHPKENNPEIATLWLYCRSGLVVTVRHKPLRLIERLLGDWGRCSWRLLPNCWRICWKSRKRCWSRWCGRPTSTSIPLKIAC